MREVCEAYTGITPLDFEQMHPNQIMALVLPKEYLKTGIRTIKARPRELAAKGFLGPLPKMSYTQMVRQELAKRQREGTLAKD